MKDLKEINFTEDKEKLEEYFNEKLNFFENKECKYIFPKSYKPDRAFNEDLLIYKNKRENIIYIGAKYGLEVFNLAKPDTNFIYCFEPLYYNYQILKQNQLMNKSTNVIPYQSFVGNSNNFVYYHQTEDEHLSKLGFNDEIPTIKLDDYEFSEIGLIYIDQSQMRLMEDILKGAIETIEKHSPEIILDSDIDSPKFILKELGYKDIGLTYNQRGGRYIKD